MLAVIPFPNIAPEIFSISVFGVTLALRWYALAYIVGILLGWRLAARALARPRLWPGDAAPANSAQLEDFVTWAILGVVFGGRLFYCLVYQPGYYLSHPLEILQVWQGGMSFHGGFFGVVVAAFLWSGRNGVSRLSFGDVLALAVTPGLFFGRLANFINAELWGRPTNAPWGVVFPGDAAQDCPDILTLCARHPSQLYEAALEGLILGSVILVLAFGRGWLKKPGQIMGLFLAGYGAARIFVELFRVADAQFITPDNPMGAVFAGLSMGQILSIPMLLAGLYFIWNARRSTAKSVA